MHTQLASHILMPVLVLAIAGCAHTGRITNTEITEYQPDPRLAASTGKEGQRSGDVLFLLSFSGGGTRAAALSYGVLEELRDTEFTLNGRTRSLLDEVDTISSVSGGSFTSAYYGLFGDQIFEDYEEVFLRRNVQKTLVNGLLNPLNWIKMMTTVFNRTEMAIDYYDKNIFRGSTFADIAARGGPNIEINATDLGIGERFTFTQDRFNILCSDLSDFRVARAVAASSAVPVAFAPIALQNYAGCDYREPDWLKATRARKNDNPRLESLLDSFDSYQDKEKRPYIHLVDGGITDNLGIRALYDRVELMGGPVNAARLLGQSPTLIVVIVVNAQTKPQHPMDSSSAAPSSAQVVGAVSKAQLGRYNIETIALIEDSLEQWAAELSTPEQPVTPYFIMLDFESIADEKTRLVFNNMATSFSLPNKEVDDLIEAGHRLLQGSPEYQALLTSIRKAEQKQTAQK
jgi:NTE family protein